MWAGMGEEGYFGAVGFDVFLALGKGFVVLDVDENDASGAFFGEGDGDGVAEAAGAACYERYAGGEGSGAFGHGVV